MNQNNWHNCFWCGRKGRTPTDIRRFWWADKMYWFCDRHFLYIRKNSNRKIELEK